MPTTEVNAEQASIDMPIELIIMVALAVAATVFAIITGTALVINKSMNVRQSMVRHKLLTHYSIRAAQLLTKPLPDELNDVPAGRRFKHYEELGQPVKNAHDGLGTRARRLHREALKAVMIDLARDLSGESFERLVYFFYSFGFVDEEIAKLTDHRWWIRAQAAQDLGLVRVRRSITALTAALEDPDPDVRLQAMQALVSIAGAQALRAIFRIAKNISAWSAIELSHVVLRYRDDAVPYLLEGLRSGDQSVVLFCIDMLAQIGFVEAVEPLRTMARKYPNITIRARSLLALGELGDQRAETLFLRELTNPNPVLRVAAIRSLRKVGSPRAIPLLAERLSSAPIAERILAARSIAASGDSGIAMLRGLTGGGRETERMIAEQVLEEQGLFPGGEE